MIVSKDFIAAFKDYFFLMNKSYPDKGSVKFVGDRYGLSGSDRSMLYRGVHAEPQNAIRRKKLISESGFSGQPLHIDSFNVLLSIISYLEGKPVYLSTDGLLRDASEWHGNSLKPVSVKQTLDILFDYLKEKKGFGHLNFYIDQPLRESARVLEMISEKIEDLGLEGSANRFSYSDDMLQLIRDGYLATSDSRIIDRSSQPVFDLAKAVLEYKFNPRFFDLKKIIS